MIRSEAAHMIREKAIESKTAKIAKKLGISKNTAYEYSFLKFTKI